MCHSLKSKYISLLNSVNYFTERYIHHKINDINNINSESLIFYVYESFISTLLYIFK